MSNRLRDAMPAIFIVLFLAISFLSITDGHCAEDVDSPPYLLACPVAAAAAPYAVSGTWQDDKALHAGGLCVIASALYAVSDDFGVNKAWAWAAVMLIGVAKETLVDRRADWRDLGADAIGASAPLVFTVYEVKW